MTTMTQSMTAAQAIEQSRREGRTITIYPDSAEDARSLLEDLGVDADAECAVWDHISGAGGSGPESAGHYDVWGDGWRVDVVYAELT